MVLNEHFAIDTMSKSTLEITVEAPWSFSILEIRHLGNYSHFHRPRYRAFKVTAINQSLFTEVDLLNLNNLTIDMSINQSI